jgi:hypothetical protein
MDSVGDKRLAKLEQEAAASRVQLENIVSRSEERMAYMKERFDSLEEKIEGRLDRRDASIKWLAGAALTLVLSLGSGYHMMAVQPALAKADALDRRLGLVERLVDSLAVDQPE